MFEKEAEEYRTHFENVLYLFDNTDIFPNDIEEAYQKGAEFGYNKANEWHYVKDGDLPKEIKEYLVYKIDSYGCKSTQVMQFNKQYCWCANCQNEIKAWKEIVLPELIIKK